MLLGLRDNGFEIDGPKGLRCLRVLDFDNDDILSARTVVPILAFPGSLNALATTTTTTTTTPPHQLENRKTKYQPTTQLCLNAAYLDSNGTASPQVKKPNLPKTIPM